MVDTGGTRVAELPLVELRAWVERLSGHATAVTTAAEDRLATIEVLEQLRSVTAAAQAREVAELAEERRAAVEAEIATVERPGVGKARRREEARRRMVAAVAQARRVSPWQANRFVAFAEQARTDLPETYRLLATGQLSEHRARLVFTAVAALEPDQRRVVDAEIAPELPGLGDARVDRRARAAVYAIDPAGVVQRNAYALGDRRVSVRPAPDCMAFVTTLTTMPLAVAVRAQLERDARAAQAAGDERGLGALMSDIVVSRVLDPAAAVATLAEESSEPNAASRSGRPTPPDGARFTGPVAVQLLITDRTLAGGDEPARFPNGEPYPAPLARDLALATRADGRADPEAVRSVRRLFEGPDRRLVTAETTSRTFTPAQRELVMLRDGTCTTPWCDAPIVDIDHHDPSSRGGPTSVANARGLCRWCNVTKGDHVPPPSDPPRARPLPPCGPGSPVERRLRRQIRRQVRRASRRSGSGVVVDLPGHSRA